MHPVGCTTPCAAVRVYVWSRPTPQRGRGGGWRRRGRAPDKPGPASRGTDAADRGARWHRDGAGSAIGIAPASLVMCSMRERRPGRSSIFLFSWGVPTEAALALASEACTGSPVQIQLGHWPSALPAPPTGSSLLRALMLMAPAALSTAATAVVFVVFRSTTIGTRSVHALAALPMPHTRRPAPPTGRSGQLPLPRAALLTRSSSAAL